MRGRADDHAPARRAEAEGLAHARGRARRAAVGRGVGIREVFGEVERHSRGEASGASGERREPRRDKARGEARHDEARRGETRRGGTRRRATPDHNARATTARSEPVVGARRTDARAEEREEAHGNGTPRSPSRRRTFADENLAVAVRRERGRAPRAKGELRRLVLEPAALRYECARAARESASSTRVVWASMARRRRARSGTSSRPTDRSERRVGGGRDPAIAHGNTHAPLSRAFARCNARALEAAPRGLVGTQSSAAEERAARRRSRGDDDDDGPWSRGRGSRRAPGPRRPPTSPRGASAAPRRPAPRRRGSRAPRRLSPAPRARRTVVRVRCRTRCVEWRRFAREETRAQRSVSATRSAVNWTNSARRRGGWRGKKRGGSATRAGVVFDTHFRPAFDGREHAQGLTGAAGRPHGQIDSVDDDLEPHAELRDGAGLLLCGPEQPRGRVEDARHARCGLVRATVGWSALA